MMNEHSVLDTEVNGSRIGDGTLDMTESTTGRDDDYDDYESPSVLESAEASFPSPEELRSSRTSRSGRSIWKGASSPKNDSNTARTDRNNKNMSWRLYAILVAVVVLVFLVIIPAVVVSSNNKEVNEASTSDENAEDRPRPTFAEIIEYVIAQNISSEVDVMTPDSPQYKAAMWLMQDDPANIPVPTTSDINTYDGYRYMTRYIMAVNFFAFNGTNWQADINWMTGSDVCDWNRQLLINGNPDDIGLFCYNTGVETDEGTVIKRFPSSLQLVALLDGSIPRENGMLTTLASLQFAGNTDLVGSIPTELCSLTNLNGLYMNVNRLSGNIPSCLGDLRNLKSLNLGLNDLVGTIPAELCQLSKLEALYLSVNLLDGPIPSCLGDLPIALLDLASNMLTGSIPSEFENLDNTLFRISLDSNMLSGDPSDTFNKLVLLDHLTASSNRLNFTMDSTFLANTRGMQFLDLSNNNIEGSFPIHLLTTSYRFLLILDVSKNGLSGEFSSNVTIASPIVYLGAHDNQMTGTLSNLVNLTNLKHLDLSINQFTGSMEPVSGLTSLLNLFLSENPFDAGPIPESFGKLRKIQELSLRNTNLTGTIPTSIAENWTIVELIDLGANSLEGPIPENFGNLSTLQYLLLHDNNGINGTVPAEFQFMTQLKGVLLDRTSIDGQDALNLFCQLPNFKNVTGSELLIVDCEGECIECDGCRCCNDAETSSCSKPQLGNIDGLWYQGFVRPKNEFNFTDDPNLLNRM